MTAQERIEPIAVDTVVTGEWIITLNAAREIYRARTGPWTWDQAGPAGADGLPDWLRMDADAALGRLAEGVRTVRKFNHPRILDAVTIEGVGTCSDALNRGAADLGREYDSLFVLHKSTSEAEVELELKVFGERPVAHMHTIGALHDRVLLNHMTSLDERDVELVCASGARISQNPTSALKLAKGTTQTGKWKALAAAGVPMALGTDTANFDLRPLHNPVANIVYGSTGHSVDTVLIGGDVVLRHKQLTSLDEARLRHQVEAINRRVLGEIGIAPLPRWPVV